RCARPCRPDPRCPDRAPRAAAPATRRTRWSRARCRPTGCRSRARTRRPGPRRDRPRRARGWQTCRPPPHRSAAPGAGPGALRTWPAERSPDEDGYAESAMADVIVGRFALIDLIAKGGSGSIWRAWDSKAEQVCAAKVLRQRDSADLMRFVREKGVSFDHPHLLTPYGWGAEDEHVVIAMPLVTGGTLESVVKHRGKLAEPAVVVVLVELGQQRARVGESLRVPDEVAPVVAAHPERIEVEHRQVDASLEHAVDERQHGGLVVVGGEGGRQPQAVGPVGQLRGAARAGGETLEDRRWLTAAVDLVGQAFA